jgi:hypothetical protein
MQSAANSFGANISVKNMSFQYREKISNDGKEHVRNAFVHAKWYAAECGSDVFVFIGSANCSQAALTIPGSAGNAELLSWSSMSVSDFQLMFLNEFMITDSPPMLATELDLKPAVAGDASICILAAGLEAGRLEIVYRAEEGATVTGALVDEVLLSPDGWRDATVSFQCSLLQPRTVVLVGLVGGKEIKSGIHWIDNEAALRVSARSRSLADSIDAKVRKGIWSIGAWTEVLAELYRHIEYMPERPQVGHLSNPSGKDRPAPAEFTWEDVFASDYHFKIGAQLSHFALSGDQRIGGLRSMLLRWFGIARPEQLESAPPVDLTPGSQKTGLDQEGDVLTELPKTNSLHEITKGQRKHATKIVAQIVDRLSDRAFLSDRPAELLASDLKVLAVLLRAGLADRWLSEDEFLSASVRIWLPLFFNAEGEDTTGWIEQRYLTAPDQEHFADSLASVELAAALASWALSIPENHNTPEHTRFVLASVLSLARLPWLWQTGGNEAIARHVADVFAYTSSQDVDWALIERSWLRMARRGYALQGLQVAIADWNLDELSKRIGQKAVEAGELLWQGKFGFCVAGSGCERAKDKKCEVLLLQRRDAPKLFSGPFLIPVKGLLEGQVIPETNLPARARGEIADMMRELSGGLRQMVPKAK